MTITKYLSIITLNVNELNAPIKRQMNKEYVVYIDNGTLAIKKSEILPFATT